MEKTTNRREKKKLQVLHTLVDASIKLFLEKGFIETTIVEITDSANIATGTFYNYFQSKEDLLRYVLNQKIEETKQAMKDLLQLPIGSAEKLSKLLYLSAQVHNDNKQLFDLYINHLGIKSPPHGSFFKDTFITIIQEGQENGVFNNTIPTEMIAEMFMGLIRSAMISRASISLVDNLNYKLSLFMDGLATKQ